MKIAVEGCAHGQLERIYETIELIQQKENIKVDLLLCCGDFQATRNFHDLECMAVPMKYRQMCTFYKYYSGEKVAPILTLFVGGNHEASNYLQELPYGGWVAPNIYYMGTAGVVNIAGLKIAGLSGIYKAKDYPKGRYEKYPYTEETKRSVYHIRNIDVFRLKQMESPIDIFFSHDWPSGVYNYGRADQLLRIKPFFTEDINENKLGSPPSAELLFKLKPSYWFAAHLHCKFAALIPHKTEDGQKPVTKFLALDKCLPKRKFLQILDIAHHPEKPMELEYDLEWLTVLYNTNHLISTKRIDNYMPGPGIDERWEFTPKEEEKDFVLRRMEGELKVPNNFCRTAPAYEPSNTTPPRNSPVTPTRPQPNPQTQQFCSKLGVGDPLMTLMEQCDTPRSNMKTNSPYTYDSTPDRSGDLTLVSLQSDSDASPPPSDSTSPSLQFTPSPKVKSLSLPAPKFSTEDESNDKSLDNTMDNIEDLPIEDTEKESNIRDKLIAEDAPTKSPMMKKFKRRNIDLYRSRDEDEDSNEAEAEQGND